MFIGGTDVEAETPILWPPDAEGWFIWKDPDAGKDWGQEEKGMTEDDMVGWHHRLDGHGFGWTLGVGDGQGGLACCGSWSHKESDMSKCLNWTELMINYFFLGFSFFNIIINLWIFFTYRISFSQLKSLFSLMLEFLYLNYGWTFSLIPVSTDIISLILESFLAFWECNIAQSRLILCLPARIWINHFFKKDLY